MILVTGGARSGKSSFAESLLEKFNNALYIATSIPFDDEMKKRVEKHKNQRNKMWDTLEAYKDFDIHLKNIDKYDGVILDCITIMVSNIILEVCENFTGAEFEEAEKRAIDEINKLISILKGYKGKAVIVTNEVGFGVVPESKLGRHFRDIAGRINQHIAKNSSEVYLVISSIPMKIK